MINKQLIQKISNQEMDRKDFLKYSGLVVLSVVGLRAALTTIEKITEHRTVTTTNNVTNEIATRGFGSGKYGG